MQPNEYFNNLIRDDGWYSQHKGKHIAIVGEKIYIDPNLTSLTRKVYEKFPNEPVFIRPITREPLIAELLTPFIDNCKR